MESSSRPSIRSPAGCAKRGPRRASRRRPLASAAPPRCSASTPARFWPSGATPRPRSTSWSRVARPRRQRDPMIDFYYWPTPNGWKVSIMLEECALPYRMIPVNIGRGDQFTPEFLEISPNNRMPAIVDHDAAGGPLPVFESGAILIHLAERAGRFMPTSRRGRKEALEWLFWQVGNLGPMAGQLSHFVNYAQGEHEYAHRRYADEDNGCL